MFMFAYHLKINDEYEHPYDIENDNIVNTIIHCILLVQINWIVNNFFVVNQSSYSRLNL